VSIKRSYRHINVCRFFHSLRNKKKQLETGKRVALFWWRFAEAVSGFEIYHPELQVIVTKKHKTESAHLRQFIRLPKGSTQTKIRQLCEQALERLTPYNLQEWLPDEIREAVQLTAAFGDAFHFYSSITRRRFRTLRSGSHPHNMSLV